MKSLKCSNTHASVLEIRTPKDSGINQGKFPNHFIIRSIFVQRLGAMSGAVRIRFAGKILGSHRNYWVAAGALNETEEASSDLNHLVYWVTDNLLGEWIKLPDCNL